MASFCKTDWCRPSESVTFVNIDPVEKVSALASKHTDVVYKTWQYTLENPEEAIGILAEYHPINKDDYLANLKTVMAFFQTDRYKNIGIGYIDPQRIQDTYNLVDQYQNKLNFPVEDCYDSSFLPDPMYKYNF